MEANPYEAPIIQQPVRPEPFWQCPQCLAAFALRFIRTESQDKSNDVLVYRCKKCGKETQFLGNVPSHAV